MKRLSLIIVITMLFLSMTLPTPARAAALCYVNASASGANNGASWTDAYIDLQSAIADNSCIQIWVAAGTYKPTPGSDRTASFALRSGLAIYGGFAGTETLQYQRNPDTNVTILSGDLAGDDSGFTNNGENSYHVLIGSVTTYSAVLDGFTIKGGNANSTSPYNVGGGMLNISGSPTLENLIFTNNSGGSGGGIYNEASSPNLTSVTFSGNRGTSSGGGMVNHNGSNPHLTNVTFSSNTAAASGAGMFNDASSPTLFIVTFMSNQAASAGGGMFNNAGSNPSLSNVTFTSNAGPAGGGGMYNKASNPSLTNVTFQTNTTSGGGGGMGNYAASPTLFNVTFSDNSASAAGGGMANDKDSATGIISNPTLTNVIFENNHAQRGGGLASVASNATLKNVTFVGNTSSWLGGAIYNGSSNPTLTNVTIANNTASSKGGGLYNSDSSPSLMNVTISGNWAAASSGGGIYNTGTSLPILMNTIVANSVNGGDCIGTVNSTSAHNLIEDASNSCGLIDGIDPVYNTFNWIGYDPILSPLANNGGYTQTMALNYGSLAIDMGIDAGAPSTDQRGVARPANGTNILFSYFDIGAYEYVYQNATRFAIPSGGLTTGLCDSWANACTLQRAIVSAKAGDQVWVQAGTYTPDTADRTTSFILKNDVAIYGGFAGTETLLSQRNPVANVTILSGDIGTVGVNTDNSYHVVVGIGSNKNAILDGFTISGGYANGASNNSNGGGVYNNNGSPTLRNLTISGNYALVSGGGMRNENNSNPALINVTFSGNTADEGGGAIYNHQSSPTLSNVTFSANTSAGWGGGLTNYQSSPTLRNVTFSDNVGGTGGAIFNSGGSVIMINTIVANSVSGGDCVGAVDASSKNNLIKDTTNTCGLSDGTNGNVIGLDPQLGALTNNGGFTQTMALGATSPAIDKGDNAACADANTVNNLDQRGVLRPQNITCDIGAYELQWGSLTFRSSATQDGWVLESTRTSNVGGTMDSKATTINIGDDVNKKQYRGVLSFDTTLLPDNAIVIAVTLKFKSAGIVGGGNPVTALGGFLVDIKTGAFGANSLELSDFQSAASKASIGPYKISPVGNWYAINLVKGIPYINKLGLTQVRLRFKLGDNNNTIANYLKIYSGNAGAATRPQLIVKYYVP